VAGDTWGDWNALGDTEGVLRSGPRLSRTVVPDGNQVIDRHPQVVDRRSLTFTCQDVLSACRLFQRGLPRGGRHPGGMA